MGICHHAGLKERAKKRYSVKSRGPENFLCPEFENFMIFMDIWSPGAHRAGSQPMVENPTKIIENTNFRGVGFANVSRRPGVAPNGCGIYSRATVRGKPYIFTSKYMMLHVNLGNFPVLAASIEHFSTATRSKITWGAANFYHRQVCFWI